MLIKGIQKTTLLDFPGRVACTIFTGGCNFRCPFCHNASLVTEMDDSNIPTEDIFNYLKKRKGILDGVCITGGEPLLQPDLEDFINEIRALGLSVKLDTNGSRPEQLKALMDKGLLDYIAMDIKSSASNYSQAAGTDKYMDSVECSIDLLMSSDIPYEFRTTVVRELHTPNDILDIAKRIRGTERYFLQGFKDSGNLIEEGYSAYSTEEMQSILNSVQKIIPSASLRGID